MLIRDIHRRPTRALTLYHKLSAFNFEFLSLVIDLIKPLIGQPTRNVSGSGIKVPID